MKVATIMKKNYNMIKLVVFVLKLLGGDGVSSLLTSK